MQTPTNLGGITLIELMIVRAIMAILLAVVIPAFANMVDRHRLKAATETLYFTLHQAKSEAIKRNKRIRITFKTSNGGTTWCYGLKVDAACDCTVATSCQIDGVEKTVESADFSGVGIDQHISSTGDHITFDNMHWIMAGTFGHLRFNSPEGKQARVIVSRMSKLRLCSPSGSANFSGYSTSC
jgi:type IV fimbrial biogenesis protein FimT